MALTDPHEYKGEVIDTNEIKIDQLKKHLANYAYQQTTKVDKKLELVKFSTNICGKKASNLCVIIFING